MGRVYLPESDLIRFGCAVDATGPDAALVDLVRFECARARALYREGLELLGGLDRRSRACVAAMAGIYRRLLGRIEAEPLAVLDHRVSIPTWEKVVVAARSLAGSPHEPGSPPRRRRRRPRRPACATPHPTGEPRSPCSRPVPASAAATWSFSRNGLRFDNGQHVYLRCCTAYQRFLERLGTATMAPVQERLELPVLRARPGLPPVLSHIRRGSLPAPLHVLPSLMSYAHVPLADRLGLGRAVLALMRA